MAVTSLGVKARSSHPDTHPAPPSLQNVYVNPDSASDDFALGAASLVLPFTPGNTWPGSFLWPFFPTTLLLVADSASN